MGRDNGKNKSTPTGRRTRLTLTIVPSQQGRRDSIRHNQTKNLIVVPLPYDGSFMEVFYQGWQIVQQFINADATLPRVVALPRPADRQVCRFLEERRDFPVVDVIESLRSLAQPELLETRESDTNIEYRRGDASETNTVISPLSSLSET